MRIFKLCLTFAIFVALGLAGSAFADQIISDPGLPFLTSVASAISGAKLVIFSVGAIVVEIIAKLIPTANPQGWLIWGDKFCQKVGAVAVQVGQVFVALDGVIVQLIPQNLAGTPPKA